MKGFIGQFDESMIQEPGEFDKRYQDTWLELESPKTGVKDVFMYQGNDGTYFNFNNPKYGAVRVDSITEVMIRPVLVNSLMINTSKGCRFVWRSPVRRNQRSLSDKNTLMSDPFNYTFKSGHHTNPLRYDDIRNVLYDKQYPSIHKAIVSCTDRGIAFSEDYSVYKDTYGTVYLFYRLFPIGYSEKDVLLVDGHYLQEFSDWMRDNCVIGIDFREDL